VTNATYGKLTAGLIVAWFTFSLSASALHLFRTDPSRPPLPLLLAVVIPIFLFFLWYRSSRSFRDFVLSLNPANVDDCPGLEDSGLRVSGVVHIRHSARYLRVTIRLGRHRDRCDRDYRRHEAGQSEPQEQLHPVAVARNHGSGCGSRPRRHGSIHRPARSYQSERDHDRT
jgi:hypothetical protein